MNQAEQDSFKERNPVPERQLFENVSGMAEFEPREESNFESNSDMSEMMLV